MDKVQLRWHFWSPTLHCNVKNNKPWHKRLSDERRRWQTKVWGGSERERASKHWMAQGKRTYQISHPSDWMNALLLETCKLMDLKSMVTIGEWTSFTNTLALQQNASQPSHLYPDWSPFTPTEIKNFLAFYIVQGLSPSPRVKMIFYLHHEDSVYWQKMYSQHVTITQKRFNHGNLIYGIL